MVWDNRKFRWQRILTACDKIGGETRELKIEKQASETEVLSVENKLGLDRGALIVVDEGRAGSHLAIAKASLKYNGRHTKLSDVKQEQRLFKNDVSLT